MNYSTPVAYLFLAMTFLCPNLVNSTSLRMGGSTPQPVDTTSSIATTTPSSTSVEPNTEGHLPQPVTPTEMSNCIPSASENVTLERLVQQMMIDAIKQEILITLGLRQVPSAARLNASVQERRQILRLYNKSLSEIPAMRQATVQHDDDEKFRANQFHSFVEQGDRPPGLGTRPWHVAGRKRLFFALNIHEPQDANRETIVKMAKLKLFKEDVRPRNLIRSDTVDGGVRIDVFQLLQTGASGSGSGPGPGSGPSGTTDPPPLLRRTVDSRLVSLTKSSWEEFDVSAAVQDWIRNPGSNLGLEVTCDSRYRLNDLLDFVVWSQAVRDSSSSRQHLPTLNVLTQERRVVSRHARSTTSSSSNASRSGGDCVHGGGEHRCCRYPLTVSFRDIGWESWIIHPREYQVYYCAGTCPSGFRVAHRFSSMKTLLTEVNPDLTLPVRCAPMRLLPLIVVHMNSEGNAMTVSSIDNMIPEDCMCA